MVWCFSTLHAASFAQKLEYLLNDLKSGVKEPLLGIELLRKFYEADAAIFERCDDSGGHIDAVFRYGIDYL